MWFQLLFDRIGDRLNVSEDHVPVFVLKGFHKVQVLANPEAPDWLLLKKDLQLLGLGLLQYVWLKVFEDGHTHVDLVVWPQQHTGAEVVADLRPVQVVPETLSQPVDTHLRWCES